jgi:hypothetical protein
MERGWIMLKWLYKLKQYLMELFHGMAFNGFEVDHKKLEETMAELNKATKDLPNEADRDDWETVPGLSMLTEVTDNSGGPIKIMPYGIVLIVFVNKRTGELKIFPNYIFSPNYNAENQ